jgi:hypothetical protein
MQAGFGIRSKVILLAPLAELVALENNIQLDGALDVRRLRIGNNNPVTVSSPGMFVDLPGLCTP